MPETGNQEPYLAVTYTSFPHLSLWDALGLSVILAFLSLCKLLPSPVQEEQ